MEAEDIASFTPVVRQKTTKQLHNGLRWARTANSRRIMFSAGSAGTEKRRFLCGPGRCSRMSL
jgi:hypothetical protein